jgi:hypothetical protein
MKAVSDISKRKRGTSDEEVVDNYTDIHFSICYDWLLRPTIKQHV